MQAEYISGIVHRMEIEQLRENAAKAADILSVMSNPTRLLTLCYLCEGEKTVQQLQDHLGSRQSALSQHLAILRRENLVETRREGQNVHYSLVSPDAKKLILTLCEIYCS